MRKTSRLTGPSINGHANIDNIPDTLEERLEITVGHFEGHIADKEGLRGCIFGRVEAGERTVPTRSLQLTARVSGILNGEAATFEQLLIKGFNGLGSSSDGLEIDIAESIVNRG